MNARNWGKGRWVGGCAVSALPLVEEDGRSGGWRLRLRDTGFDQHPCGVALAVGGGAFTLSSQVFIGERTEQGEATRTVS